MSARPWAVGSLAVLFVTGCLAASTSSTSDGDAGAASGGPNGKPHFLCEGSPVPFCAVRCGLNSSVGQGDCATGEVCCYPNRDSVGTGASPDAADGGDAAVDGSDAAADATGE